MTMATLASVIKVQAVFRRQRDRGRLVEAVLEQGRLLAMPGTIQGRSGWYESGTEALKFDVVQDESAGGGGGDTRWDIAETIDSKQWWLQRQAQVHRRIAARDQQRTKLLNRPAAAAQDVYLLSSVMKAVVHLQSNFRRSRDRNRVADEASKMGWMLALPGTVQGRSGWYQNGRDAMLFEIHHVIEGEDGGSSSVPAGTAGAEEKWEHEQTATIKEWMALGLMHQ